MRNPADPVSSAYCPRRAKMRWEVPQAIDFRFGMEITMYIARR
ncbi:MAG: pyrroloquinoline quinone precursor peptide PqqA [Gammaproteobacteria bacterium]|nr:pyrroloquinoline quinone precursor peptide PqqA [Gammaproteobacteria bacterium]